MSYRLGLEKSSARVEELKDALREAIREELTSGDVAVAELTNAVLKAIRDRLPSALTAAGNLKAAVVEDAVGLAKSAQLPSSLTAAGNLKSAIVEDALGLAKSTDVSAVQPRNLAQWGGTALTGRDVSGDLAKLQNLDTALTSLARLMRWGIDAEPDWVPGTEVTAPAAGTALVSKTVSTGKVGYIYGFFISAGEANDFKINYTSGGAAKSIRVIFSGKGTVQYADLVAMNKGEPADAGSSITITNVNAGSAGIVYQARLLYAEV